MDLGKRKTKATKESVAEFLFSDCKAQIEKEYIFLNQSEMVMFVCRSDKSTEKIPPNEKMFYGDGYESC